jgi:hypothetical protein
MQVLTANPEQDPALDMSGFNVQRWPHAVSRVVGHVVGQTVGECGVEQPSALGWFGLVANFRMLISRAGRKMFVSLFQMRRQHIFDPFHECADSARQIAPMCDDEGHGERPATTIGYDLHKRSTL